MTARYAQPGDVFEWDGWAEPDGEIAYAGTWRVEAVSRHCVAVVDPSSSLTHWLRKADEGKDTGSGRLLDAMNEAGFYIKDQDLPEQEDPVAQ